MTNDKQTQFVRLSFFNSRSFQFQIPPLLSSIWVQCYSKGLRGFKFGFLMKDKFIHVNIENVFT